MNEGGARSAPVPASTPSGHGLRKADLGGGRRLVVRCARPSDVDGLGRLFDELELEDRHRRFFTAYRPDRRFLEALTHVPAAEGVQLVAVAIDPSSEDPSADGPPGATGTERLVAEAGYRLLPDGNGELAITVAPGWRGWLGPFLLDALLDEAAARGVPNLEADVLVTNRPMVGLLHARGEATLGGDDPAIRRVVVSTSGTTPTWPPAATHPRVLVEVPGGTWHATEELRRAGVEVIACPGPLGRRGGCPALRGEPCPLAAAADAIVLAHPMEEAGWRALPAAHAERHPGVPVCVEATTPDEHGLPTAGPHEVVELVHRLLRPTPTGPEADEPRAEERSGS